MKKYYYNWNRWTVVILLSFMLPMITIFSATHATDLEPVSGSDPLSNETRKPVVLVHSTDYRPLFYVDGDGVSKGLLIDYWKLWSKKAGIPVRFEPNIWHECIERARTDKNVIIPGIFYTPERDVFLDFSQTFMDIKTSLFVRTAIRADSLSDLDGKTVGVTRKDRVESFLAKNYPSLKLKAYDGFKAVVEAAVAGEIDIFAMDRPIARYYLKAFNSSKAFGTFRTLYVGKFCAGVREGNSELLLLVNHGIEQIHKQEIDTIFENWLSRSGFIPKQTVRWIVVSAGVVVLIVIMAGMLVLRTQVRNRTLELDERIKDLRESEERYKRLSEVTQEGIVFHRDGKVVDANDTYAKILGYEIEELIGTNVIDTVVLPEYREIIRDKIQSGYTKPYEVLALRKDGKILPLEVVGRNVQYQEKSLRVSCIRDITAWKKAETQHMQLQRQLQRSQEMEAIGTLAGGVAHDLNNILSGLVSYPELLLTDLPEDSPLRKPILTIQKSGQRASAIVQDLLTLARRGIASREVVNLNHIISGYLKSPEYENLKSQYPEVTVTTDLADDLMNISGSPVHLSKTVMNLVNNAAEAMPGGGTVAIETDNRYIDVPIPGYDNVEEGDYAILTVTDSGVGISPESIERIFEPFYTKKVMGRSGSGLGMAVVWGTVKDHHGYIDVQSTEGEGTKFTLYFPVTRKERSVREPHLSLKEYMAKGEAMILVVDDIAEQREIASEILNRLGYSVATAASGEEAIEYMKTNKADLLLLDMIMDPGIDGLDTYKGILELHPNQKAVIVSGFSESDRVKAAHQLGAGAFIKKPYLMEKLGLAIRKELEGHRDR